MLLSLTIENYALIGHLEFRPTEGLTVITGETGAGKSIIMGALGLILGQRADARTVRVNATKCVIEAQFNIDGYGLQSFFTENDLEYDSQNTIIRREIFATGKSRAFVNDTPVQLTLLKQLGDALIDIHSQHQNLLLGNGSFQQEVVDAMAKNKDIFDSYITDYRELTRLRRSLQTLKAESASSSEEADYIHYQFNKLDEAQLRDGELAELEEEQELLSHAEDIKSGLANMAEQMNGDGISLLQTLKQLRDQAQSLSSIYPRLQEIAERMESVYIDLKDIADDVENQAEEVNFDPERFAFVEERLGLLYSLLKKHNRETIGELIALRDELQEKILHIDNSDEEIAELEQKVEAQTAKVRELAKRLTESRTKAARSFEQELVQKVAYLGMPNVRFEVQILPLKDFSSTGADSIQFLFSANKNQPLKPAGEVASGGEISRLMLSIKALIAAAKTLPTIIFDEIDTGVSGDIADRMGEVMKQISEHLQVITITHLPQVAGKGDAHFMVYKEDTETETQTHIAQLSADQRVREIARMLSGARITEQAIANARILMGQK
ncbi:MAG: DNA repair protein RecN [Bacteroidales bacterium]|nr:DNA repair protein RecN [Bacteroidales bacterium]